MWLLYVLRPLKVGVVIIPIVALLIVAAFIRVKSPYDYTLESRAFVVIEDIYIGWLIALSITGLFVSNFSKDWKIFHTALVYTLVGVVLLVVIIMPGAEAAKRY